MSQTDKAVQVLVASMVGAVVVFLMGDLIVYPEGAGNESLGFAEGSTGAQIVNYAPVILIALGLYGAFREFTDE